MKNKKIRIAKKMYSYKTANAFVITTKILAVLLVLEGVLAIGFESFVIGIFCVVFGVCMFLYSKKLKKIIRDQIQATDSEKSLAQI